MEVEWRKALKRCKPLPLLPSPSLSPHSPSMTIIRVQNLFPKFQVWSGHGMKLNTAYFTLCNKNIMLTNSTIISFVNMMNCRRLWMENWCLSASASIQFDFRPRINTMLGRMFSTQAQS